MGLPSFSVLLGDDGVDDSDDLADALQEMHGHMQTGNYKGAADSLRAARSIMEAEQPDGGDDDLYD